MRGRIIWRLPFAVAVATVSLIAMSGCAGPEAVAQDYFRDAVAIMDDGYYADSDRWAEAREAALERSTSFTTIEESYADLARLITVAGGPHSRFLTPDDVQAASEEHVGGGFEAPTVTVSGGVGTISLPAYGSFDPRTDQRYIDDAIDAIEANSTAARCGWIVDVSGNSGGDAYVMLAAVSPLLDDGNVLQFVDRDGGRENVNVNGNGIYLDSDKIASASQAVKLPHGPVAVVQDRRTASAAEAVVVSFRGQADSESFGQQTAGMSSANTGITLSDGAMAILTDAIFADRAGEEFGKPIQPDHRLSIDNPTINGPSPAEWVQGQCVS